MRDDPEIVQQLRNEEHLGQLEYLRTTTQGTTPSDQALQITLKIKESAIESSINAIVIADLDGILNYVNQAFLKMWGYSGDEEVLGKEMVRFWQMKGRYVELMDHVLAQGGWKGELVAERKDGSFFDVELSASVVKDDSDQPICMMVSSIDITDRKKAENELRRSHERIERQNVQLKKLDRIKSDFLNVTSHELRTPMSAIKGYIQMIMKGTLGDVSKEQTNALNIVLRNTNRLDHLIQDILDISRLESGTMKFIPEKTSSKQIVIEAVETMQATASEKQIQINTSFSDKLPDLIVDPDRVKQVLINLLSNAIKFTEPNTTIDVQAVMKQDRVEYTVKDYGRGIPKNKQNKIFDTFYQVDSGMDRKFGGAGLGLAICRGIILSHGGEIWVESVENKGSIFHFTLPIQSVEDVEERFKQIDVFGIDKKKENEH